MNWDSSVVTLLSIGHRIKVYYRHGLLADGLRTNDPARLHTTVTVSIETFQSLPVGSLNLQTFYMQ